MAILKIANQLKIWRDNRGAAAVEFALVVPFLTIILINVVSFFDGFRGNLAVSRATVVLVDLVTRNQGGVDDDDFTELVSIAQGLVGSYSKDSNFTVTISSIRNTFDTGGDTDPTLVWSRSNDDTKALSQSDLDDLDLPSIPEGDSVILTQIEANYTPFLVNEILGEFLLSAYLTRRPRFVSEVACTSDADKC